MENMRPQPRRWQVIPSPQALQTLMQVCCGHILWGCIDVFDATVIIWCRYFIFPVRNIIFISWRSPPVEVAKRKKLPKREQRKRSSFFTLYIRLLKMYRTNVCIIVNTETYLVTDGSYFLRGVPLKYFVYFITLLSKLSMKITNCFKYNVTL